MMNNNLNKILLPIVLLSLCTNVMLPMFFGQEKLEVFDIQELFTTDSGWWSDTSWSYSKKITVDNTKVDATLTNFPILVQIISDTDLSLIHI